MTVPGQNPLLTLARRLRLGRLLRYLDLWARYLWRRGVSALRPAAATGEGAQRVMRRGSPLPARRRPIAPRSAPGFPSISPMPGSRDGSSPPWPKPGPRSASTGRRSTSPCSSARPSDLAGLVDRLAAAGTPFATLNTALYLVLLRRLPAAAEGAMIASRHPRHALIAIQSGDEFARAGRRTLPA